MKNIIIVMVTILFITACSTDLDQTPPNIGKADAIENYELVLFAAYGYQFDAVAAMAVFGDFRSDNCLFDESPYTDFEQFGTNSLASSMSSDFFRPFYAACYNSILKANEVIKNSTDAKLVGEAKFIRGLSYFKLVQVFGDVTVNLGTVPNVETFAGFDLKRKPKNDVYNNIIIPDLKAARDVLTPLSAKAANGRATSIAAQGLLGKVYATMGNYSAAVTELSAVLSSATAAGVTLEPNFAKIFGSNNDLNSEVLFATQISSSSKLSTYSGLDIFTVLYEGGNTKADDDVPIDADLIAAFNASTGDLRKDLTLNVANPTRSVKYSSGGVSDADWIELRLSDVIMLYAEALNETTNADGSQSATILAKLDPIRTRAGLASLSGTATTQASVRKAILDERRLEFACEGQRWFDLIRFDAAQPGILNAEMGKSIDSKYYLFPIPITEVTSFDEIVQNPGY